MYQIELELMGEIYKSKGKTISEGLSKLKYPKSTKSGVIRVINGKKSATHVSPARQLNRLYYNIFVQAVVEKRLLSQLR